MGLLKLFVMGLCLDMRRMLLMVVVVLELSNKLKVSVNNFVTC